MSLEERAVCGLCDPVFFLRCFPNDLGVIPKFQKRHCLHITLSYYYCVLSYNPVACQKVCVFAFFISAFFREAAKECRRRKKEYVKCLESRVAMLEVQNKKLVEELETLKDICSSKTD